MKKWASSEQFLKYLNTTYFNLHKKYEDYFWLSYMGDHSYNKKKDTAIKARDSFRTDTSLKLQTEYFYARSSGEVKRRLGYWVRFFSLFQVPPQAKKLKDKISELETKIETARAKRKEGYIDPKTKKFVAASSNAMSSIIATNNDEKVRRACFDAIQRLPLALLSDYIVLVNLRNKFARTLGYTDFYAYKLDVEEGMKKSDLFPLFEKIYQKTKFSFKNIRTLEKTKKPGLRYPWNFSYMLAGAFAKEEDPYFSFEEALIRWGTSFAALGIDYKKGNLVLDLLDRKGKYENGFCHWPEPVRFDGATRIAGRTHFTCNVVLGIPGQGSRGMATLFHEGGHAAHLLNCENRDVCLNTEYPPASTAWDETQSMFLDTVFSSIEWRTRYAKKPDGTPYPFELFERKIKELGVLRPQGSIHSVAKVCEFEKRIYEAKNLTKENVITIAKKVNKKYNDMRVDSISLLEIPHIYSWESACSYHGYGLATLALIQWREYFFKKYGYIVDNPSVGKEMARVWQYGAAKTFPELVKLATGKRLSADPYIRQVTMTDTAVLRKAKERIATLSKKPRYTKKVTLNAKITMVDGKKKIADNSKGFEAMAEKYAVWLKTKYPKVS